MGATAGGDSWTTFDVDEEGRFVRVSLGPGFVYRKNVGLLQEFDAQNVRLRFGGDEPQFDGRDTDKSWEKARARRADKQGGKERVVLVVDIPAVRFREWYYAFPGFRDLEPWEIEQCGLIETATKLRQLYYDPKSGVDRMWKDGEWRYRYTAEKEAEAHKAPQTADN